MSALTTATAAISLLARELGSDVTLLRTSGKRLRYLGVCGGDHVVKDWRGRVWRIDLVTESVALSAGLAPRVAR